ncbi:RtcB family protein [Bacteroidales bacterium OttesenSCG-928-B11]|nr:RtcB family protein [Bacteroidales bacterium OttesenSCG-928-E04]MDL2308165.1 RtcB family protein [Bacteroidales bacterium OttesenSCG-928-C03]MDL2311480.1 RtcB family protein [Bacteroidales bacterium OttesenSCG-928-B11]MDL2325591.1 RtcB family protein [Bacteroidales bacterium OttesenSCG-928-A14]
MQQVISTERIPIKMWLDDAEEGSIKQAKNLANLPFAFKHVCLMPDTHQGYGMPIGGVLATQGVIIPNAVGVDIGCGMCAVKTNVSVKTLSPEIIKKIMKGVRDRVPLGFNHHKEKQNESRMPQDFDIDKLFIVRNQYNSALKQIGTLGGGNHFIELQKDETGMLWIMIHSGSRNIGLKVAEHYNNVAKNLNASWYSAVDPKWDLAFLPFNTEAAKQYYQEMLYCVSFAFSNRQLMMERIQEVVGHEILGVEYEPMINIAHNYAAWEEHFGEKVIVHRKGATSAFTGEIGIIPGSQGTKSYIVEGLGNPESFMSCSHGAGRTMSRAKAVRELDLEEEKRKLDERGIIHSIRGKSDLEEAASAYKEISKVMELQQDLVKIRTELSPIAVIKG